MAIEDRIPRTIWWEDDKVRMIDQSRLPLVGDVLECEGYEGVCLAIRSMAVRGAPALGVAAALAVAAWVNNQSAEYDSHELFFAGLEDVVQEVKETRPTAVNLAWGAERMRRLAYANEARSLDEIRELLVDLKARVITKLIVGQFEYPVAELAAGQPPAEVRNLVRKEGAGIVRNPVRPYLTGEELDAIPFVSRFLASQVDLRRYKTPSELFPYMDILTGRGCCYGHCTYCLWVHTYVCGTSYSVRSIGNVIEELRYIERELPQVRSVMLQDDTFPDARAREFSEAKLAAGIRLPWSCYARGNMSYEVMALMKRAGCLNLHVGYESADPEVLQRIKKGVTVERMTQFTDDAKRAGLRIHGDFAVGFPGETPESFEKTIAWAKRLDPYTAQFQLMIPFPGTPYYNMMKEEGWLNERGEPDMPQFPNEQIRAMAKRAYRRFYLTPRYLWKCLCHPYDRVLVRLKTMARAVPAMFWRRW